MSRAGLRPAIPPRERRPITTPVRVAGAEERATVAQLELAPLRVVVAA